MDVIALAEAGFAADRCSARHGADRGPGEAAVAPRARAGAVLRRRCGRPQGGLPRRRDGAAAPEARASACASPSSPTASIPTTSIRQQGADGLPAELARDARPVRRAVAARGAASSDLVAHPSSAPPSRRASRPWSRKIGDRDVQGPLRARAARDAVDPQSHGWCARSPAAKASAAMRASPARGATILRPTGASRARPAERHGGQQPSAHAHRQATAQQRARPAGRIAAASARGPAHLYPSEPSLAARGPLPRRSPRSP